MKITVIGGTGFIGAKIVRVLRDAGRQAVAASLGTGVNTLTGEGLSAALEDTQVVMDVTNPPSLDGKDAMAFFETSGRNIASAAGAAGVGHHIVLSIVGADRLASGYFRAKVAQEALIRSSPIPHTIVRCTQFFEFIEKIVENGAEGETVRLPQAQLQPVAGEDAALALADIALGPPKGATLEVAGPEAIELVELAREFLSAREIPRRVLADPAALYFGAPLQAQSLIPGPGARLASITFANWLRTMIPAG